MDAERASGFRYGHRAFLVQLRRDGAGTVLIDPVACPDLSGINDALADAEAVIHAASQDLPCLADLGYRPRLLFDTELAGRLLGYPRVGLGTLVESVLGLTLEKSHSAADWSTRPLPEEWLRYAALDVEVLVELRDALAAAARRAGQGRVGAPGIRRRAQRRAAAAAAGAVAPHLRHSPGPQPARPRRRPRAAGWSGTGSPAGVTCRRPGCCPTRRSSRRPGRCRATPASCPAIPGFSGRGARRHTAEWLRAVGRARSAGRARAARGVGAGRATGPPPAHRWPERDPDAATRLTAVRAVVAALADEHHLPAENLLPPDAVRRLAWQPPDPPAPRRSAPGLAGYGARPWQVDLDRRCRSPRRCCGSCEKGEA